MMRFIKHLVFLYEITSATKSEKTNIICSTNEIKIFGEVIEKIINEINQKEKTDEVDNLKITEKHKQKKKYKKSKTVKYKKFEDIYMNFLNIKKLMVDLKDQFNLLARTNFNYEKFRKNELSKSISCSNFKKFYVNEYKDEIFNIINSNELICIRALMVLHFLIKGEERSNVLTNGINFDKENYYIVFEAAFHKITCSKYKYDIDFKDKKSINLLKILKNKKVLWDKILSCIIAEIIFKASERIENIKNSIKSIIDWYYLNFEIESKKDMKNTKKEKRSNGNILINKLEKSTDIVSNELTCCLICNEDFFKNFLLLIDTKTDVNVKEIIEKNIFAAFGCMVLCGDENKQYTQIVDILYKYDNLVNNLYLDYNISKNLNNLISIRKEITMRSLDECLNSFDHFKQYLLNKNYINRRNYGVFNYCLTQKTPTCSDVIISIWGEYNMLFILFKELEIVFFNLESREEINYELKLDVIQNILLLLGNCYFDQIDNNKNPNINSDKFLNKYTEIIFDKLKLKGDLTERLKISFKTIYLNEVNKSTKDEAKIKKCLTVISIMNNSEYITLKGLTEMEFIKLVKCILKIYKIECLSDNINDLLEKINSDKYALNQIKTFYLYLWNLITSKENYTTDNQRSNINYAFELFFNAFNTLLSNELTKFRYEDKNVVNIHNIRKIVEKNMNSYIFKIFDIKKLLKSNVSKNNIQGENVETIFEYSVTKNIAKTLYNDIDEIKEEVCCLEKYLEYQIDKKIGKVYHKEKKYLLSEQQKALLNDETNKILFKNLNLADQYSRLKNETIRIVEKTSMTVLNTILSGGDTQPNLLISKEMQEDANKLINLTIKLTINLTIDVFGKNSKLKEMINTLKIETENIPPTVKILNIFLNSITEDIKHDISENTYTTRIMDIKNNLFNIIPHSIMYYETKSKYYSIQLNLYSVIVMIQNYSLTENDDVVNTEYKNLLKHDYIFFLSVFIALSNQLKSYEYVDTYMDSIKKDDLTAIIAFIINYSLKIIN